MPRMGKFPAFGKRFFRRARKLLGSCHFAHFWRAVVAIAAMNGRRSLDRIEKACRNHRTRQSIAFFLSRAEWDAPEVLRETALDTLKKLGWKLGETVYVVLDDTQKKKRGKRMDAVSKIFLHAEKVYAQGHTILGCALVYRGVVIPYAVRLWACEEFCEQSQTRKDSQEHVDFRKLTALAGESIEQIDLPKGARAIVMFDSYYLCPRVIRACKTQEFPYVGVAKKNRNFYPDKRSWDKRKVGKYGANVLKREGCWQKANGKKHRLAQRVGRLSKIGRVKLVFSRRPRENSWITLATNETRWAAATVLSHYLNRWWIEVHFKMSKQYLGLGDYQLLRYRGIERYLHLVMISYLLLTHLAAPEPSAQADLRKTQNELRLQSILQVQQVLREKLWDDTVNNLVKGSRNRRVGKKMKELLLF